jgi:hypothetical protein
MNVKIEKKSDTLPDFIKKIVEESPKMKTDLLIRIANTFLESIRFTAPRDTGEYANSWRIGKIDENSVTISTPHGDLAIYLEYGTAPHPIFPKRKKTLHWVDGSGDHFALYVRHPGFPAKPHIRPSMNVVEAKINEIAMSIISKYFKL